MNGMRFDADEFLARALDRLLPNIPDTAVDMALEAPRSDDDLNAHLPATFDVSTPRPAAVLVPVVRRQPELTVLLTQRTDHLPSHPGQVAFPGGKIDAGDADATAAALRETEEETGLDRKFVETIGFLDSYQTRTGFRVLPVVALVETGFELVPEAGEVADIFEVPLRFLMDPSNHLEHTREWQGVERRFYAMPYGERYIWGATAGMLRNLYDRMYRD
jgi:8-oxo-dGTP pyrophosphatase MutT (NUDIX family)